MGVNKVQVMRVQEGASYNVKITLNNKMDLGAQMLETCAKLKVISFVKLFQVNWTSD